MKKQTSSSINAHLFRSAFILLSLLAVCLVPFALGQQAAINQTFNITEPQTDIPCTHGWSAGGPLPTPTVAPYPSGVHFVGVYFPANGKFYAMGGQQTDEVTGSEFTHPFEYNPTTNTWTTKQATYPWPAQSG